MPTMKNIICVATIVVTLAGCAGTSPTAAPQTPSKPIPEGTYLVGTDIKPGVYKSAGPKGSVNCYWQRMKSLQSTDVIDLGTSQGPQVVEILPGDAAFLTRGCKPWEKAR